MPLGLWIGALAVFLVLRPVTRRALASTARNGRLVGTALLHGALGVAWSLLPATLGFSLLAALAFTAFHYLLTVGLGRAGLVVSLFVLAVQVTATGGIYPIELLSAPFQLVSPFLPLTWGVDGMHGIIAGGSVGGVVGSALLLALFAIRTHEAGVRTRARGAARVGSGGVVRRVGGHRDVEGVLVVAAAQELRLDVLPDPPVLLFFGVEWVGAAAGRGLGVRLDGVDLDASLERGGDIPRDRVGDGRDEDRVIRARASE